ncbi:MAG TPA: hypothetical protein HA254_00900 [Candidatus Diapherotrites archaeon]|uniref:Uncharacterized protein n=1 Tax=Candidatus Iainarchaeum sp. TaxID=3101447 RepID=A0A7J4IZH3_9ARCH|nr:hypothetical protein [Candidatus Diapherotrites archaeon]
MTYAPENDGKKSFVLDSSSIITIADNCFIRVLRHLSEKEGIEFIIPASVYAESVTTPLAIKRFEFSAVRIRDAVEDGYIRVAGTTPALEGRINEIESHTRDLCSCSGRRIILLQRGEIETLALLKELGSDVLVIDERTTRMLLEEPSALGNFLRKRHRCDVKLDRDSLSYFRRGFGNIKVFRSVELISLAYEDGSFEKEVHKSRQALEAALYAAKFAGCSVSFEEIKKFVSRVRG